jgi:serine/threonine-protein kinase
VNAVPDARTEELFARVLELVPAERARFLEAECAGDAARRREVETLLHAHERSDPYFEGLSGRISAAAVLELETAARPKVRIGPYRTIEVLGSGGMGVVYRARRVDGEFDQEVALKLLHLDVDSPQARARFLAERQILAGLEHPHVARLLDGGVTEEGRPYFVMELVEGRPITEHCRERRLGLDEVLDLFGDVIDAVGALHRRLIVHRDLKPSNILVRADGRGRGVVKLLDFGIAKLLDERGPDLTRTGERLLTPRYAAPEQLGGGPIGTAVDVYGLGLVLYELLAGRLAFDDPGTPTRVGSERDLPPAPSAVLRRATTESAAAELPWSWRRLDGDLDRICLKALEPDPERRWATVDQLAQDLERHRAGLPVTARAPTLRYRAGKYLRRHRLGVAVVLLVAVLMGAGFWRERTLRRAAELARSEQVAVSAFLERILSSATPEVSRGREVTVAEILGRASAELGASTESEAGASAERGALDRNSIEPSVEAAVRSTIGNAYLALGDYQAAIPHLERSLELHGGVDATNDEALAVVQRLAEVLHRDGGEAERAERLATELLERRVATRGEEAPETLEALDLLAGIYARQGRLAEAEAIDRRTVEIRLRKHGERDPGTLRSMNSLASTLFALGRYDEAAELYRRALDISREVLGEDHPDTLKLAGNLAVCWKSLGRPRRALPLLQEAVERRSRVMGEEHAVTATAFHNLGVTLLELARYDEAEAALERAIAIRSRQTGPAGRLGSRFVLAQVLAGRGQVEEATQLYREVLSGQREVFGPEHHEPLITALFQADLSIRRGRLAAARSLLDPTLESLSRVLGDDDPRRLRGLVVDARLRRAEGRFAEARMLAAEAAERLGRAAGNEHPLRLEAVVEEARALYEIGDVEAAEQLAGEVLERRRTIFGDEHPATREAGELFAELGRRASG